MASSRKKKSGARIALIIILLLVLILAVAVTACYGLFTRRLKALQAGAAFSLEYEITPTADSPALYNILQQTGATKGTLEGSYEPDALQVSISASRAVIPASPLTRVWISSDETLYDAGQLYRNVRSSITNAYPLAGLLFPDWSIGSYISQSQLAALLGVDASATSLQDVAGFQLDTGSLKKVEPDDAKEGYLYVRADSGSTDPNAPELIIGVEARRFFEDELPVEIRLTIPEHGVRIVLTGTIRAENVELSAPTSRMNDDDIQTLVQIRETIQSVLQFVQSAAQSTQTVS